LSIWISSGKLLQVEKRTKSEVEEPMIGKQIKHRSLSARGGRRRVRVKCPILSSMLNQFVIFSDLNNIRQFAPVEKRTRSELEEPMIGKR